MLINNVMFTNLANMEGAMSSYMCYMWICTTYWPWLISYLQRTWDSQLEETKMCF